MADHSELAVQHLGVLTVNSTPVQIAAALASASAAELVAVSMEVDGAPVDTEGVPSVEGGLGIRNRLNSFVAGQGDDPLSLLSSSNAGSAGLLGNLNRWKRPNDTWGIAMVSNGISTQHQNYLAIWPQNSLRNRAQTTFL